MADLAATGMTADQIALVMELAAAVSVEARPIVDEAAQRRRERDREYQAQRRAERRHISADSADVGDVPALSLPPNENKSNPPAYTHPEHTTPRERAKGDDPFPCPEWCDSAVWTDLKRNRRTKKLTNTATAHRQFVAAVLGMVDDDWPPGRLVEAIAAKGWGGAYDPREDTTPNDRQSRKSDRGGSTRSAAQLALQRLHHG